MIEKRIGIRLNLEKLSHKQAYDILSKLPNRRKSEFIINAIVQMGDKENLYDMIKQAVEESLHTQAVRTKTSKETNEDTNVVLDYLSSL